MPTEMPTDVASEEPLSTALMLIDAGLEAVAGLVTDSDALPVAPGASDESEAAPNDAVQPAGAVWLILNGAAAQTALSLLRTDTV